MNNFLQHHLDKLKKNNFTEPELELRILLNESSVKNKSIILSNFNIKDINLNKFNIFFYRRLKKEPISKIFNKKSFWKYDFFVNQDVLDPRPETELIIENILDFYPNKNKVLKILDMCTGSGCIAISLAKEYKKSKLVATDISLEALEVAKFNARKYSCSNQIKFLRCDLLKNIELFDIVVSNPPYLSKFEYKKTSSEILLYEPKIALEAKNNGLEFYYKISKILPKILDINSKAFIEIGCNQAKEAINIFNINNFNCLKIVKDIQNLNRLLVLNKS